VTQRGISTSFTVVTGHEDPWAASETDWEAVARVGGTIIVLMGVATRAAIAERLMTAGLSPSTPVVAIRWGTRPEQQTVRTTLTELGSVALEPPVTMVIGGVAALDVSWFESRPLFGKRVVVTRAREQASDLATRLAAAGASVIEVPAIVVRDPADGGAALRAAANRVREYAWVVFTSVNAVSRFLSCVNDARDLGGVCVAAIGSGTAAALQRGGIVVDLVPERYVAESLLEAFPDGPGTVLIPRAAVARDVLPDGLRAKGWNVDVVEAYRTERVDASEDVLAAAKDADAITFTSSSTVSNFVEIAGADHVPPVVVCIGPVTAETARAHGLKVDAVAEEHTIDGLVRALSAAMA
jgi:uroporphyrinogen III methyltransferase/synthase